MCDNISRPTPCGLCSSKSPTFAVRASPVVHCCSVRPVTPSHLRWLYLGERFSWKDLFWHYFLPLQSSFYGEGTTLRTVRSISHTIAPTCSSSLRFLYLPQDRTFPVKPVIGL